MCWLVFLHLQVQLSVALPGPNEHGPSIQVNTACSSGMIAIDLACQSLRSGQCSMALVAGSNAILTAETSLHLSNMNFLSPDSLCYSFDHRANGYARGEGVIVFALKSLQEAVRDGDMIRAVIRATGSNQDGHTPGITQPSLASQEELIRNVYKSCNLGFGLTRYVEAHGTGTQLGDSTEARALGRIFRASRSHKEPLYIGSIKANIGHLEAASGLVGVLKCVMILEKGIIPPNALFEKWNPKINANLNRLEIPTECVPWPADGLRRVSINSFGFGGSNGHIIMDDALHTLDALGLKGNHQTLALPTYQKPKYVGETATSPMANEYQADGGKAKCPLMNNTTQDEESTAQNGILETSTERENRATTQHDFKAQLKYQLLVWSARDEAALRRMLQQYDRHYKMHIHNFPGHLEELAETLGTRRSLMTWRASAVVSAKSSSDSLNCSILKCIRLYLLCYPIFQSTLARANSVFRNLGAHYQPICTVLQIALVELLKSFGIVPEVVLGHSSGEIVAAYTIGALSFESACKVAYHRGRLSQQLASAAPRPGAMMSANLRESDVDEYLEKFSLGQDVHVACVNSPFNVTLSGNEDAIDKLNEQLNEDKIFARKLKTGMAYHSPAMQEISGEYLTSLGLLEQQEPVRDGIMMVSSVTGQRVSAKAMANAQYWVDNLVSPVRFADALEYLALAAPKMDGLKLISDYLEIGPHGVLQRPVSDTLSQATGSKSFTYASVLSKFDSPLRTILKAASQLFARDNPPFLVNLPQYPFDHSQLYWQETRLSRDWRLRTPAPREVLGVRVADWNPLIPRWRKILSVRYIPWIADHIIANNILFPVTATIMMALKAVKQVAYIQKAISGYHIKEAVFKSPIVVQAEGQTEAYETISLRFEVQVFVYTDNYWSENFKAIVCVEYDESPTEALISDYVYAKEVSTRYIRKKDSYGWCKKQGFQYGDAFSLAEGVYWDGDQVAVAYVDVGPPTESSGAIVCFIAPSSGMSKTLPTNVPYKIEDAWISETGWHYPSTSQFRVAAKSQLKAIRRGSECSITILIDDDTPLCRVNRFELQPLIINEPDRSTLHTSLHRVDWKPQFYCAVDEFREDEAAAVDYCVQLESALRNIVRQNLDQLRKIDWSKAPLHMKKFVSWAEMQCRRTGTYETIEKEKLGERLEDLKARRPSWRVFIEVAQNICSIVAGETDALELLFSTPLVQSLYDDFFDRMHNPKLMSYLELSAHQTPNQKILEVGAGTGAMTRIILSLLQQIEDRTGGMAFSEYSFTDVSTAFFENAQKRFAMYNGRMTFKPLDLERDVIAQGFPPEGFDLILAGDVLHTTRNLSATLQNLRRTLKPGGHLIFRETTALECFAMDFCFGILPGWWRGEEKHRTWSPTITEAEWDTVLQQNEFSGNDLVIRDYRDEAAHWASMIITTAGSSTRVPPKARRILLVIDDKNEYQKALASVLVDGLTRASDHRPEVFSLSQLADAKVFPTNYVTFLADLGNSLLAQMSKPRFSLVKGWIQQSGNMLWVTSSNVGTDSQAAAPYPFAGIKDGLLRSVRAEFNTKHIISLSLEDKSRDITSYAKHISRVLKSALVAGASSPEVEYMVRDGKICTGRLVKDVGLNRELSLFMRPTMRTETWLPGPPLKLDIGNRGQLETLYFKEDTDYYDDLGPTDVEIEAKAWAANFRDVFSALGRLDEDGFGSDCAGVVTRVGPRCQTVRVGDRVCMCVIDCMRTYPRGDEWAVVKIPDAVSFEEACAVINPGLTSWQSLIEVGRLQEGEKILIHAASGATGQLAVQIAQMAGAEVFATVGYDHKKQLLIDEYGIPADHIFYSRNTSFAKGIMRMTDGYGVDVVLNSLVGEGLRASWECIAPYGRFIEIGKADINANSALAMGPFAANATFTAVDLLHTFLYRKEMGRKLLHKTMDLAATGIIRYPKPLNPYDVSSVEDAFRYFQSGKSMGRIVIRVDSSTEVQKYLVRRRAWSFDKDATYIVAGGLGGIGRSIVKWMVTKGARYLLILSRSGIATDAAAEVVTELAKQGVTVHTPKCDTASLASLSQLLEECGRTFPPIRGCINAAMVLNDSTFDNMTHAQWESSIRSKVRSSWNLNTLLPSLDFFILLSSLAGIVGSQGQANYAAGCTFQDSLARFRTYRGQKAISIDLGLMRTIGIVAETESLRMRLDEWRQPGLAPIEEPEFLALLDICCDHRRPDHSVDESQIMMGVRTPAELITRSLEPPEMLQRPLFAPFSEVCGGIDFDGATIPGSGNVVSAGRMFRQLESAEERASVVVESLAQKLARALSIKPEDVDASQPLHAFGVDSLVAVELRNWFAKEFAADVPVFEIMSGRSVAAIGDFVTSVSQIKTGA
ncbi:polyketide synthase PksD [Xylariaceae sp. FL0662B]|nr:polyketide synthase PksD [Xylariaceae sp. FL0662B]